MKILKSIIAAALIALTLTESAKSATITCETYVASKHLWVRVMPELKGQLNGKVVNNPKYGWVTDSVAPGEEFKWGITASTSKEKKYKSIAALDYLLPALLKNLPYIPTFSLPLKGSLTTIPTQLLRKGNKYVVFAETEAGQFKVEFPVEPRP